MKTNDPVLVLITIAVLVIEAAVILARAVLVPMVALVLTLANWRRPAPPEAPTPAPAPPEAPLASPTPHPLAAVADRLALLPVTALRTLANTRSKRHNKAGLVARLAACI